ncbi:MAG: 6,7-dimethyl-8-ribityllumazine synthase [Planctomycetota bacterium]
MQHELRASPAGRDQRVGIVVARFNEVVTERLRQGAVAACREAGVADDCVTVLHVPGAFELPLACEWLAASGRFTAIAALGAVVRGETGHYDHVCSAATDGVLRVTLDHGVPIGFGVLTCDTMEQALARAGGDAGNKGADAVLAALEMAGLRRQLGAGPG